MTKDRGNRYAYTKSFGKKDSDRINALLLQVAAVHHDGARICLRTETKNIRMKNFWAIIEDDDRPILVACDDENIAGYAFCIFNSIFMTISRPISKHYISMICVDEKLRDSIWDTLCMRRRLLNAKDHDCYNVTLNVWACNTSAMKFYERCGLKPQKVGMELILDSKE